MYPYNPNIGQTIQTNVAGVSVDRGFIAHIHIAGSTAVAKDADGIHAGITLTAASANVSTAISSITIPRNITVAGNADGITGNVILRGTNYQNSTISETIALSGSTVVEGNKAFANVTSINVPIETHASTDVLVIGFGDKIGLPYTLENNTVLKTYLNNSLESNAPTVTCSETAIESNTIKLNSALNGNDVDIYLIV